MLAAVLGALGGNDPFRRLRRTSRAGSRPLRMRATHSIYRIDDRLRVKSFSAASYDLQITAVLSLFMHLGRNRVKLGLVTRLVNRAIKSPSQRGMIGRL